MVRRLIVAVVVVLLAGLALAAAAPRPSPSTRAMRVHARVARVEAARRARAAHDEALAPAAPQAVVKFRESVGGAPTPMTAQKQQQGGEAPAGYDASDDASSGSSSSSSPSSSSSGDNMEDLLESDQDDGEDSDGGAGSAGSSSSGSGNDTAALGAEGPPYSCKAGHGCPGNMTNGVCCKGGNFCCEELCLNDELPLRCGTTQGQIRAAREAYAENLRQAHLDEELTKKALEHQLYKRRLAMEGKTEQVQKSRLTLREEARKREITAAEEREKQEIQDTSEARIKLMKNAKGEEAHKRGSSPLRLEDSVRNYGKHFRNATYRRLGPLCVLSGRVRISGTFGGALARLPAECRPRKRLVFDTHVHNGQTARVDVATSGQVVLRAAPIKELDWLAFDGVSFFVAGSPEQDLELLKGWYHRPGGDGTETNAGDAQYQNGGYNTYAGICSLTGVVQVQGTDKMADMPFVSQLPPACRPGRHSVYPANNHAVTHRVDVFGPSENGVPGGKIFWSAGNQVKNWISLDGIMLLTDTPKSNRQKLTAAEGFRQNPEPYNELAATLIDDSLVVLSGLVSCTKSGSGLITVLPENTRPSHRLVFGVITPTRGPRTGIARVDIMPSGEVWWIQSPSDGTGPPDPSQQDSKFRPAGTMLALDRINFAVP